MKSEVMVSAQTHDKIPFFEQDNPRWRRYAVSLSESDEPKGSFYEAELFRRTRPPRGLSQAAWRVGVSLAHAFDDGRADFYLQTGGETIGDYVAVRLNRGTWEEVDDLLQGMLQPVARG